MFCFLCCVCYLDMLQSLMSPLALNQPVLDPFSVGSVSSMSSPTTTLSPGNY